MTFKECVEQIRERSVIDFKEYELDRHERRKLTLQLDGAVVQKIFQANEKLPRDVLEQYYGEELDEQDYLQLSEMNCPRIVVSLGVDENNNVMNIKVLVLNQDFYNTRLQELTITNELDLNNMYEPSYVQAQRGW